MPPARTHGCLVPAPEQPRPPRPSLRRALKPGTLVGAKALGARNQGAGARGTSPALPTRMPALSGQLLPHANWFWVTSLEIAAAFCSFLQLNLNKSRLTKLKNLVKNGCDVRERRRGWGEPGEGPLPGWVVISRLTVDSPPKTQNLTLGGGHSAGACAGFSPLGERCLYPEATQEAPGGERDQGCWAAFPAGTPSGPQFPVCAWGRGLLCLWSPVNRGRKSCAVPRRCCCCHPGAEC